MPTTMKHAQHFDLCERHKSAQRKLDKYLKGNNHRSNSLKLVQINKGSGKTGELENRELAQANLSF